MFTEACGCFQALILAMGFHEKGRSLMKRKQYDNAVCHLLKADEQFRYRLLLCSHSVSSSIGQSVVICLTAVGLH